MDLSKKKVFIWDLGLQGELAKTIAEKAGTVWYYVPTEMELYPTPLKSFIGKNLEGVERVSTLFPYITQADAVIVPESQLAGIVSLLRHFKLPVAGPSLDYSWLESERWKARLAQDDMGLPVQNSEALQGIDALSQFFDSPAHANWLVKGNGYRGLFDTFPIRSKKDLEPVVNFLTYKLGPFKNTLPFMVEEKLDGLETGYDTISWDKEQVWPSLLSLAAKDECYLAKVCTEQEMPTGYRLMHELLSKNLDGYRFFYSVETITGKDQVPYIIDLTIRIGSPSPLSIYLELYENFAEIICGMALGEKIAPKVRSGVKYAASVNLSLRQDENFTNIEIPEEIRRYVKLVRGCKHQKEYYTCPEWEVAATVLGFGSTMEEALKEAKARSKELHGKGLVDNSGSLDDYYDDIKKAKEIGINF